MQTEGIDNFPGDQQQLPKFLQGEIDFTKKFCFSKLWDLLFDRYSADIYANQGVTFFFT